MIYCVYSSENLPKTELEEQAKAMSISFSGLASGLDTSSWVQSLTALKRAKVTTLTEEKQAVQSSLSTLSGIKSFFNSFRSMLEKVTDTKFNVANLDLFSQKLAISSNTSVLTALAKAEAEEGKYEIKVDKLASNTTATSGYKYTTTIVETTTASKDSLLKNLGIKSGEISVDVNGISYSINITDSDTLGSLVQKFRGIGVDSSFNEKTGIFTLDISTDKISDIGNTGIVDGLHLSAVNHGYSSNNLQVDKEETVTNAADGSTKLSDLGVGTGTITIETNSAQYNVQIEEGDTLQDLMDVLTSEGIDVSLKDGVFRINDAVITDDTTTGLLNAFGLTNPDVAENTQISNTLSYMTVVDSTTAATGDTLLTDLAGFPSISNTDTVTFKRDNGTFVTVTLSTTDTLDSFMGKLEGAGLDASLSASGSLSISGGSISASTFGAETAFKLTQTSTGNNVYTNNGSWSLTTSTTSVADRNTTFAQLGFSGNDAQLVLENLETGALSTITMSSTDSIRDLISDLGARGISASMLDGKLTISEVEGVKISGGSIAEKFGLTSVTRTETVSTTQTSGNNTYEKEVYADTSTTLGEIGLTDFGLTVKDQAGNEVTATFESGTTIGDVFSYLSTQGINASMSNGVITLNSVNGKYVEGAVADGLGITTVTSGENSTVGSSWTSTEQVDYTTTVNSNQTYTITSTETITIESTTTSTTGTSWTSTVPVDYTTTVEGTQTITIPSSETTTTETVTTTTVGGTVTSTAPVDYTTTVNGTQTNTITGTETTTIETTNTTTVGGTVTSTAPVDYTTTVNGSQTNTITTTETTTITETSTVTTGATWTSTVPVDYTTTVEGTQTNTITGTETTTIETTNTTTVGGTVTSTVPVDYTVTVTGSQTNSITTTETTTIETTTTTTAGTSWTSTAPVTVTSGSIPATGSTTLNEINGEMTNFVTVFDSASQAIATLQVDGTQTIDGFISSLSAHGITGSIVDGVITLDSTTGNYLTGDLLDDMGVTLINSETIYTTTPVTQTSTAPVTFTKSVTATANTTLAELGITDSDELVLKMKSDDSVYTTLTGLSTKTIDQFFDMFNSDLVDCSITDGVITIDSNTFYLAGSAAEKLGLQVVSDGITTVCHEMTSTAPVTYTAETYATANTLLKDVVDIENLDDCITVYDLGRYHEEFLLSEEFDDLSTVTLGDFMNAISMYTGESDTTWSINNGVITFEPGLGYHAEGEFIDALGLTAVATYTDIVEITGITATSSEVVTISQGNYRINTSTGALEAINGESTLKTVVISSSAELQAMNGKSYTGVTFFIEDGLSVSGNWQGIKLTSCRVYGTEGGGSDISMSVTIQGTSNGGLFSSIGYSTIMGINTTGTIALESTGAIGGIAGIAASSNISNCRSNVRIGNNLTTSGVTYIGGIAGRATSNTKISACHFNGAIHDNASTPVNNCYGGIVGEMVSGVTIENALNTGSIIVDSTGTTSYYGGIVGQARAGTIRNSYTNALLAAPDMEITAGLIAGTVSSDTNITVTSCVVNTTYVNGFTNLKAGSSSIGSASVHIAPNTSVAVGYALGNYHWDTSIWGTDNSGLILAPYATGTLNQVTTDTDLACLGYTAGDTITWNVKGNGSVTTYSHEVQSGDTIAELISSFDETPISLSISNGKVSFDSVDGFCLIKDTITPDGTTAGTVFEKLGFTSFSQFQNVETEVTYEHGASDTLTESSVVTISNSTTLSQLGVDSATITNDKTGASVTLAGSATFADLNTALNGFGWSISVDATGKVETAPITNYSPITFSADLAEALGFETLSNYEVLGTTRTVLQDITSTGPLYISQPSSAAGTITLGELGVTDFGIQIKDAGGSDISTTSLASTTTIDQLVGYLNYCSLNASYSNGVLSVNPADGRYFTGGIADGLGMTPVTGTTTTTVSQSAISTALVTYTSTYYATSATTLGELGLSAGNDLTMVASPLSLAICGGGEVSTITTFAEETTLGEVFNALSAEGITATINDGVISVSSSNGKYITGNLADALGIDMVPVSNATPTGNTWTSTISITYNGLPVLNAGNGTTVPSTNTGTMQGGVSQFFASGDTTFSQIGLLESVEQVVVSHGMYATITVNPTMTIDYFITQLNSYGFNASISSQGKFTIQGDIDVYVTDMDDRLDAVLKLENKVGEGQAYTFSNSILNTSSNTLMVTTNITATNATSIGLITGSTDDVIINFANSTTGETATMTIAASNTVGGLLLLDNSKMYIDISNGIASIQTASGWYITGGSPEFFEVLNFDTSRLSTIQTATTTANTSSQRFTTGDSQVMPSNIVFRRSLAGIGVDFARGDATITNVETGEVTTFGSSDSVNSVCEHLKNIYGVEVKYDEVNGFTIDSSASDKKFELSQNLADALKLNSNKNYVVKEAENINENVSGSTLIVNQTETLSSAMTFESLGVTADKSTIVIGRTNGTTSTVTVSKTNSVNSLASLLNLQLGSGSFSISSDGKVTVDSKNGNYIISDSGNYLQALNINSPGYTVDSHIDVSMSSSSVLQTYTTSTITADTTFAELGLTGTVEQVVYSDGVTSIITVGTEDTVGSFVQALNNAGFTASLENGTFSIAGTENTYITDLNDNLDACLGLTNIVGEGGAYTVNTQTITTTETHTIITTETVPTETTQVKTLSTDTTFAQLGLTGTVEQVVVSDGVEKTITVQATDTVGSFVQALTDAGFTASVADGVFSVEGKENTYFNDFNDSLDTCLGLTNIVGEGGAFTTQTTTVVTTQTIPTEETETVPITTTITHILTADTKFKDLGLTGTVEQVVYSNGVEHTITVGTEDTVGSFINALNSKGFSASIDNEGKFTIAGAQNVYMTDMNDSLDACLGLDNVSGLDGAYTTQEAESGTVITTTITTTETIPITTTQNNTMTAETTFGELGLTETVEQVVVSDGVEKTITVQATDTVGSFVQALTDAGFTASVTDDGRFSVEGKENTYFNDFNDSLDTCLGLTNIVGEGGAFTTQTTTVVTTQTIPTEETETVPTSTTLTHQMTSDTTFAQLGLTEDVEQVVYSNGVESTITVKTTNTVGNLVNMLYAKGFSASVDNGQFTIEGGENAYITDLDDRLDACLGLENVTGEGGAYISTTTPVITTETNTIITTETVPITTTITQSLTNDTTFAELGLTDSVEQVVVYNGVESTITVQATDKVGSFINKLNTKGIVAYIEDGKFTISGSANAYITDLNDSLDACLKLENVNGEDGAYDVLTSSTISNSTSSVLRVNQDARIDNNTTLGSLDGFVEGTFTYYDQDGNLVTNSSITLDSNDTIGDFFNKISAVGFTGTVDASGNITITGEGLAKLDSTAGEGLTNIASVLGLANDTYDTKEYAGATSTNALNTTQNASATSATKLEDLVDASGNSAADYELEVNGTTMTFSATSTVADVLQTLNNNGYSASLTPQGTITFNTDIENISVSGGLKSVLFGDITSTQTTNGTTSYVSDNLGVTSSDETKFTPDNNTLLSEYGITSGEYRICNNGVKYTAIISEGDTFGDLKNQLATFGISSGLVTSAGDTKFVLTGTGDSYIEKTSSASASNLVDVLFPNGREASYNYVAELSTTAISTATEIAGKDTLVSDYDQGSNTSAGDLVVAVDGVTSIINIASDETFGSLIDKFNSIGVEATLTDGKLTLSTGEKELQISTVSASRLADNLGLVYSDNLGGYSASSDVVQQTVSIEQVKTGSVAKIANYDTKLSDLNISAGSFALYKDGSKATINIDADDTLGDLNAKISSAFSDVTLGFEDGLIKIASNQEGVEVSIGSSIDTSNIVSICGFNTKDGAVMSSRQLYNVNGKSVLTNEGLFEAGNITEGTFIVGGATIEIDDKTTLNDVISAINNSQEANATAYWDSVDGKLVIKSKTTGASFINIEKGSSNFTDIFGFTIDDGVTRKLNTESQEMGSNAKFSINGTNYTSSSNTITSDISRIKGVTLDLKGITEGETVTLTIEKDSEKVANSMEDIVNAYNELITNIDKEISAGGKLNDQTTLKMLRNQLRSLMTSSVSNGSAFRNLDSVGIGLEAASANNISTDNIHILSFDKDKFMKAYESDPEALKSLLVGTESNMGVLTKVENIVESALKSVTGYFASAENSYSNKIDKLEDKIIKANAAADAYKARLELKFQNMDRLIAQMQDQYSAFLGT